MWEQEASQAVLGIGAWMSCAGFVTSSVVFGAQRIFPALSPSVVLVFMGSCSGLSPDLSGASCREPSFLW